MLRKKILLALLIVISLVFVPNRGRAQSVTGSITAMRLSFEAEFFNLFNQTVFSGPITSVNSVNFGRVFGQANAPRLIQFSLKLFF